MSIATAVSHFGERANDHVPQELPQVLVRKMSAPERVSISHCRLSTAMFCSGASRRNISEPFPCSDGVQKGCVIVLNIGVRPGNRRLGRMNKQVSKYQNSNYRNYRYDSTAVRREGEYSLLLVRHKCHVLQSSESSS